MSTKEKEIDILFNTKSSTAGADKTTDALRKMEVQAAKTRQTMQKIGQVGTQLGVAGAAVLAPFTIALKKYMELQKNLDANQQDEKYKKIVALQTEWNDSMARLGAIVAEKVLPSLEKGMGYIEKAVDWLEKNPGAVTALLGAGATLLTAAAVLQTISQVGLFLSGISSVASALGAGGGAATVAGGAAGMAGLGTSIAAAISAAAPFIAIAVAVAAAAEGTRLLLNWALGTSTTWKDIGVTALQTLNILGHGIISIGKWFYDLPGKIGKFINDGVMYIVNGIGNAISSIASFIYNGLLSLGDSISTGISGLISGMTGFADGGMITDNGIFRGGERGREFVMSNATTRAAERVIGGQMTQQNLLAALAGGRRITYTDNRRIDSRLSASDRRVLRDDVMSAIAKGL